MDIIIPIVNTVSPNISDGMVTLYLNDFIINNIMLDTNIPNIMLYILVSFLLNIDSPYLTRIFCGSIGVPFSLISK